MTAFLYLPSHCDDRLTRRVDLANIGSLFGEDTDEPSSESTATVRLRQVAVTLLLLLFAIGDTMLIARPDALSGGLLHAPTSVSAART